MEGNMGQRIRGALLCAVAVACLGAGASSASAMKSVCASKCAFTTIQAAVNAATPGETISIAAGNYEENVVVNKSLTLRGSGKKTVIYPGTSNPVCEGGSLCGGTASNIILVAASNVTITKMRLDGDNPNLTSGVVRGGADIDARNGVITNHELGVPYSNLTVAKVTVANIYLRGLYASTSGGSFNFNHDTVTNVQGEGASIAMFSFEESGQYVDNKVSDANDAISANWSKGTSFIGNKITKSSSGIHTDNNGGSGGSADVIEGNKVSACNTNGYGIWVFVPYVSATIEGNKISGCYIALAAFGGAVSGEGPEFSENVIDGKGAATTDPEGTYGAYVSTDQLGFGTGDVTATLEGNKIVGFGTGLLASQTGGSQATVNAHENIITGNGTGANGETGTVVEAQENYWGCKTGPNTPRCDTATGTVVFTPFLTAKP
jgi:nitrous oxidase accessory protein NosD